MLETLPEHEAVDGDERGGSRSPAPLNEEGGQKKFDLPEGLTTKNTFFDFDDDQEHVHGPATCPPPTEGWWCDSGDSSSQPSPSPSPSPTSPIGPTPLWSPQGPISDSRRQQQLPPQDSKKAWADATPDCWGPTPDIQGNWAGGASGSH